jgi:glycerophosphoryl diester phosphodiesterase
LTEGRGRLADMTADALGAVPFKQTSDRIVRLRELCDLVAGRVPLIIELKSRFDDDFRLPKRAAELLASYQGPAALMSFDPAMIETVRALSPNLPRGIVAERHYSHAEWQRLSARQRRSLAHLLHLPRTRPHFIAYHVKDLPALGPWIARTLFRLPLLTWTVRTEDDRLRALRWADQMIFEGWRPG